ncbi:hypothetical protein ACFW35_13365 [Fictibacillus sp. NPDC058756]|uniref:hypothetical protein n=1 Tax=Fictibacillus sp. NPDC058756 TaxID=3346625 RepID=UPI0036758358
MGLQKTDVEYTIEQKNILKLEKEYYTLLWEIFNSDEFQQDLIIVEKHIQDNYDFLKRNWNDSNKIKIPFERIMRHHVYKKLLQLDKIDSIFPSPISGDMGIITDDAVINIDAKTICAINNKGDIKWLQYLPNQNSFDHKNIDANDFYEGFSVSSNLPKYYKHKGKDLPVISYFLKLIYADNKSSFELFRYKDNDTLSFTCLPNGILSNLFDHELISGFKTYEYHKEKAGKYFIPKLLGAKETIEHWVHDHESFFTKVIEIHKDTTEWFHIPRKGKTKRKNILFDPIAKAIWYPVCRGTKAKGYHYFLEALNRPDTPRIDPEILRVRYDMNKDEWSGYESKIIPLTSN